MNIKKSRIIIAQDFPFLHDMYIHYSGFDHDMIFKYFADRKSYQVIQEYMIIVQNIRTMKYHGDRLIIYLKNRGLFKNEKKYFLKNKMENNNVRIK